MASANKSKGLGIAQHHNISSCCSSTVQPAAYSYQSFSATAATATAATRAADAIPTAAAKGTS